MFISEIESLSLSSTAPAAVRVVAKCLEPGALSTGRHEAVDGYALHWWMCRVQISRYSLPALLAYTQMTRLFRCALGQASPL